MELATLLERRDDVREWAVFADWLQTKGDPRGALVSLMLSRESAPTPALAEAVKAQSRLFAELTPDALATLATRGAPRLAPVFRRAFIWSAGAVETSDFEALRTSPHCALVDRALLRPASLEQLDDWLGSLDAPVPWRSVELDLDGAATELPLPALFRRAPRLEHLALVGSGPGLPARWDGATALRRLTVVNPSANFLAVLPASVRRLEVLAPRTSYGTRESNPELDPLLEVLRARWGSFESVLLEGQVGPLVRALLGAPRRPARLAVRSTDANEPRTVPLGDHLETSFALFNRALTAADHATLAQFAKLAGVTRLELVSAELQRRSVMRLHGEGDAPLVPRVAAQQLAKRDRKLDALALSVSGSNDAVSAWSFGPHVATPGLGRDVLPLARRESAHFQRAQTTRELVEALTGVDPGLDVLDELNDALDLGESTLLLGEPLRANERLRLFTDLEAQPEEAERDEYDDDLDEDEDDNPEDYDDGWDFVPDPMGGEPLNVPDYGPKPEVVVPAAAQKDEVFVDDDPEDDLDPPTPDSYEADAAEVWTEGPIDLPEHHRGPIGETFEDPGEDEARFTMPASVAASHDLEVCQHCHQQRELQRCHVCREDVCRECAGPKSVAAWDEGRDFSCRQCTPRTGRFAKVRPRR